MDTTHTTLAATLQPLPGCGWCGSSIGVEQTPFGPRCSSHRRRRTGLQHNVWPGLEISTGKAAHHTARARALCGRCGDLYVATGLHAVLELLAVVWPGHRDHCRGP